MNETVVNTPIINYLDSNGVPDNDTIHLDRAPIPVHAKRDRQCCNLTKK